MDAAEFYESEFDRHLSVAAATRAATRAPFLALLASCRTSLAQGGKILWFGNGGSAADAQHLATELVVRYTRNRRPLPSLALTTDTSALTACANDFGFDDVFARQLEALARPGDVAIGISTSGNSPNVLKALESARRMGVVPAGLAGRDGGKMVGLAEPLLIVPSDVTARIQEMHILLGHMLCDLLERDVA